jgi:hypothetical protein
MRDRYCDVQSRANASRARTTAESIAEEDAATRQRLVDALVHSEAQVCVLEQTRQASDD